MSAIEQFRELAERLQGERTQKVAEIASIDASLLGLRDDLNKLLAAKNAANNR